MNILVIAHYQDDGSPSACFIHDQVKEYVKLGHGVRVIIPVPFFKRDYYKKRVSNLVTERLIDGVKCVFFRYLSLSKYGENKLNGINANNCIKFLYSKIIGDFCPDIIHAHTLTVDTEMALYLKEKTGIPCVVTSHGTDYLKIQRRLDSAKLSKKLKMIDKVVVVSDMLKNMMISYCSEINPLVIYNGANIGVCKCYKEKVAGSIVFVGSLIKQKNADLVIRAVSNLNRLNRKFTLNIIGTGEECDTLQKLCSDLELYNVKFLGYLDNADVIKIMEKSEYFVMPSVREGFGIVYIEAMSVGCVTIGTKGEGIDGVIKNGENGLLVAPDASEITDVIVKCENDVDLKRNISKRAKDVASNFTWQNNAKQYILLFEHIVGDKFSE